MSAEYPRGNQANDLPFATQTLEEALATHGDTETVVDVDEPTQQLVLFRLNGQRFALPGSAVREILPSDQPVYYLPGLPTSTEGVLHLRGQIESLISLHQLLGLAAPEGAPNGMLLLVRAAGISSGVRIEQLDDVCEVAQSMLQPPPETLTATLQPYVSALWQLNEREALALLDPEALFDAYQQGLG
ncbi:chemotaxis protein CheW [Halomonas sp. ISL-60]|uniref:chemotaxis protein CheW n=1 Tax=unclassified Halomonas TaxID=2609666 RepID=UPI0007D9CB3D|nr:MULTISPECIES: chemotaxis protein CheW [unclassified Halomonas]MBT2773280.1 chemotaxis protein CheW [Halomonas sp. ISL-60]MBT2786133.1 chemotaxis protein CheW [Halomonas sp. ISL-106]MBT2797155.1 chemotaxis protein CheW [Halomonas sp. ISL-104]MBT2801850.1 chemotaxis protein CheW [Halomonas sp. ISL-56]OAL58536.1 chemotaxis protein [Halomonas sp. ALS9]